MDMRILVIDCDVESLRTVRRFLTSMGQHTLISCDGQRGLGVFRETAPHIVLTEVLMPEKDGIEIIREIKRSSPETKVIAMSCGSSAIKRDFALYLAGRVGADALLPKPFTAAQLLVAIDTVLPSWDDGVEEKHN